ncbi:MAG TPA: deoxyribose-phosphate aldolase [Polyangiales bacterium]|nr:deoxyribose-phosphate aldolase [Polyangiales bacterium]
MEESSRTPEAVVLPLRAAIEHTLLSPGATRAMIERHCAEARSHALFGVCVNPVHVARASKLLASTEVTLVTVVGFPLGASAHAVKAFECEQAVRDGAQEIDMVIDLGALKAADRHGVKDDIAGVVKAAGGKPVKVILETALLNEGEKRLACAIAEEAGAAFVKTSTGFGGGGATREDVALMRALVGDRLGVKASGGIRDAALARELLAAGANRIGTSQGVALVLADDAAKAAR